MAKSPLTPSIADLAAYVGRQGTLETSAEHLVVPIRVVDVRVNYGLVQFLVTPVGGRDVAWVAQYRVTLEDA